MARKVARAAAWDRAKWAIPLAVTAIALAFVLLPIDFALSAAFIGGVVAFAYVVRPIINHQKSVKERLVTRLCGFFGLEFCAVPKRSPIADLSRVRLLAGHNRVELEDQVSGVYDGVHIEMTELDLREVTRSKSGSRTRFVFQGPAFCFSFPKRFNGTTIIFKSKWSLLGNWLDSCSIEGMERVRLEDPQFDESFEVYGTDQIEARYLLTPGFMEHLLNLRASLGDKTQAAFSGENFYIVANNGENRFEVHGLSADTVSAQLDKFVADIGIIFRIIDTLNLDSRTRL